MYFRLLQLELKNFLRNPQFGANLFFKLLSYFALANMGLFFIGAAFLVYFYVKKEYNADPLIFVSKYLIYYLVIDLGIRYFMQQLPTQNIKPFLTQNLSKKKLVNYTLLKIITNFYNWGNLLFLIPFAGILIYHHYDVLGVLMWFLGVFSMFYINNFINILINGKDKWLYGTVIFFVILWFLDKYKILQLSMISEAVFYNFYKIVGLFVLPIIVAVILGYYTYQYILKNFYLDKGLEMKREVGKTENIAFLNKYGTLGTFINNDIRLIKRSKAARSALIGGVLFLFYGLLFFSKGYNTSFMQVFLGIFVTGGFNFMFGQRVPAWDSSYYPLMMTQNVPYKDFLKAKWALFVIAISVSMILAVGYAFISWEFYFTIFAAGLYNLGVNSYLTLLAGAYNKKPIDLNSASKGFTSGQNNFNIKILVLLLPQMVLPMAVFGAMKYFFGMTPAVMSLGILGLIGFLLRDKIFNLIVKIYRTEKYSTIAAFKK